MRKIVFVGTCQANAIFDVYKKFVQPVTGDDITLLSATGRFNHEQANELRLADVIVEQIFDRDRFNSVDRTGITGSIIKFPNLSLQFLWPFGEVGHPRNKGIPYRKQGPFPACDSDLYLNGLMQSGQDADTAVAQYLALDIGNAVKLQRYYDMTMDMQRKRDHVCGTDFTGLIEQRFRKEHCFSSAFHPKLSIVQALLVHVLNGLGIPSRLASEIIRTLSITALDVGETPIHPGVAKHFELEFFQENMHYLRFTGESLTFEAFWRDYMDYRWNDDLLVGITRSKESGLSHQDILYLVGRLRAGLAASSGSASGEFALGKLLEKLGDVPGALRAARHAAMMCPNHGPYTVFVARLALRQGNFLEAESAARDAVDRAPALADGHRILRDALSARGLVTAAASAARRVIEFDPRFQHDWRLLIECAIRSGEIEDAEAIVSDAIARFPESPLIQVGLALLRRQQGRLIEAVDAARAAVFIDRSTPLGIKILKECLRRIGRDKREDGLSINTDPD